MTAFRGGDNATVADRARWVQAEALAEITGLRLTRIRHLVHRKEIPYHKLGRSVLFDLRKIEAWIEGQRVVSVLQARNRQDLARRAPGGDEMANGER